MRTGQQSLTMQECGGSKRNPNTFFLGRGLSPNAGRLCFCVHIKKLDEHLPPLATGRENLQLSLSSSIKICIYLFLLLSGRYIAESFHLTSWQNFLYILHSDNRKITVCEVDLLVGPHSSISAIGKRFCFGFF